MFLVFAAEGLCIRVLKAFIAIFTGLKYLRYILLFCLPLASKAQQYPFWTQYRSNQFMMNPAVAGTRQILDARLSYRNQWTGFEGAPVTMGASFHAKVYKNKLGAGCFVFQDKIGPFTTLTSALALAYKIKFDDVALSFGANGSYNMQRANVGFMTYQNTQDNVINNIASTQKSNVFNAAAGLLLYNDRFHVGFSINNLMGSTFKYDKKSTAKVGEIKTVSHYCFSVGYNYAANPAFVWENNVMAVLVPGIPILLDYYLRLHIKAGLFVGAGIRFGTAVVGQVGWTIKEYQVSYSYDYATNNLRGPTGGSHEIKLVYFHSQSHLKHHGVSKEFLKQKFQYIY
ncbi:MAG TPA: type IX secretion system membrane protein PorP/SprF [Bacteroidia bacterium]|jgi:type IX secretion system PorP/SprF family membrane protein|nr:type IX secretion system membrane protein PorP/SprF [Bacteroidia bacterium]